MMIVCGATGGSEVVAVEDLDAWLIEHEEAAHGRE